MGFALKLEAGIQANYGGSHHKPGAIEQRDDNAGCAAKFPPFNQQTRLIELTKHFCSQFFSENLGLSTIFLDSIQSLLVTDWLGAGRSFWCSRETLSLKHFKVPVAPLPYRLVAIAEQKTPGGFIIKKSFLSRKLFCLLKLTNLIKAQFSSKVCAILRSICRGLSCQSGRRAPLKAACSKTVKRVSLPQVYRLPFESYKSGIRKLAGPF